VERIDRVLKRVTPTSTSGADTDTSLKDDRPQPGEKGEEGGVCPLCKGAGFVHPLLASGEPDFSQVVPCQCRKKELEGKKQQYLQEYSNLGSLLRSMTFDKFDPEGMNLSKEQRQNLQQALETAKEFARSPEGWLIFQGVNGCGKTHLAAAITNYRLAQGEPALFIVVPDLLDHLRSAFSPESKISYDEFFERIKQCPLLILDDYGEQSTTEWAQEKLYQLINYRYNALLPMVVTTCLSLDEIETRISSRMVDHKLSTVFNITAPDYRADREPAPGAGRSSRKHYS